MNYRFTQNYLKLLCIIRNDNSFFKKISQENIDIITIFDVIIIKIYNMFKKLCLSVIVLSVSFSFKAQVLNQERDTQLLLKKNYQSSNDRNRLSDLSKEVLKPFNLNTVETEDIIWGAGGAVGSDEGEFANPFIEATSFSAGDNPTSWTALTISDSGNLSLPGAAYWVRNTTGSSQGAFWGNRTPAASVSAANGLALFDSDFLDNGGDSSGFGAGSSPSAHSGELISPQIDLSGYTDKALSINFYSYVRDFNITSLTIGISLDDGETWSDVNYGDQISNDEEENLAIVFATQTAGIADLTKCRIRFVFNGDYYFAFVDDVVISESAEFDLSLVPLPSVGSADNEGDQLQFTGNSIFPLSQFSDGQNHKLVGSFFSNNGASAVTIDLNPRIEVLIEREVNGVWVSVHTQSIALSEDLEAGGSVRVPSFISNDDWLVTGDYRVTYTAAFDGTEDGDTTNNTLEHFFTVSNDTKASKVPLTDFGTPLATRSIFPGGPAPSAMELGSLFSFNDVEAQQFNIESVDFTYLVSAGFSGNEIQTLYARIYQFNSLETSVSSLLELNLIAEAELNFSELNTLSPNTLYTVQSSSFKDINTDEVMTVLPSSGQYLITILIQPSRTGGPATILADEVPLYAAYTQKNYIQNVVFSTVGEVQAPAVYISTNLEGTSSIFRNGFGITTVPSIALNTSSLKSVLSVDDIGKNTAFEAYPSPAKNGNINVNIPQVSSNLTIKVIDLSGRVLSNYSYTNKSSVNVKVPKQPGIYLLSVKDNSKSIKIKKIIVE